MKKLLLIPVIMVFVPATFIAADAFDTIRMTVDTICHSANPGSENPIQYVEGFGIGHAAHGDAVELSNLDFSADSGGARSMRIVFAAGDSPADFNVILDDLSNSPFAVIQTSATGGWTEAQAEAFYVDFPQPLAGMHTVYLRWVEGFGSLYQVDFSTSPSGQAGAFPPLVEVQAVPVVEAGPRKALASDGEFLLADFADGTHWNPEVGGMFMRDGLLTFTPARTGRTYQSNGRFWFPYTIDISEYARGYLQVEVMVSDILMLDCVEATIELSSENFSNLKWEFNIAGTSGEGKSPQVPEESGVWTLVSVPLYQHGWKDGGGIDFANVNRFDFHILGIQHQMEEGSVHFRNLKVVLPPARSGPGPMVIIITLAVLGLAVVLIVLRKKKSA